MFSPADTEHASVPFGLKNKNIDSIDFNGPHRTKKGYLPAMLNRTRDGYLTLSKIFGLQKERKRIDDKTKRVNS